MSVFMPVLAFFPVLIAIGFLIAKNRRTPEAPLTESQRRSRMYMVVAAGALVILIGVAAMAMVRYH